MQNHESNAVYAGFGVRFVAYVVDALIVAAALMVVRLPVFIASFFSPSNAITTPVFFKFSAIDILLYLLGTLYYVLTTYYSNATLGKKFLNIKVISEDGSKLSFLNVLYRETIGKYLSGVIIFIGYFMIAVDEQKRSLHDRLCDTRVVYDFKLPVKLVERSPGKKYVWTWDLKSEFMEKFINEFSKPSEEIIQELKKAGYREQSVFNNGNQFFYVFECDNIDSANNYLNNSPICKEWHDFMLQMAEGTFKLKKAEMV
jgi:uncharacterized RDD family membrane protein YckC